MALGSGAAGIQPGANQKPSVLPPETEAVFLVWIPPFSERLAEPAAPAQSGNGRRRRLPGRRAGSHYSPAAASQKHRQNLPGGWCTTTEQDFIRPTLDALGWVDYLPQQGTQRNEDIPDHLLFSASENKVRAVGRNNSQDRHLDALLLEESKRSGLPLDSRDPGDKVQNSTPHAQILRYLGTDSLSLTKIQ